MMMAVSPRKMTERRKRQRFSNSILIPFKKKTLLRLNNINNCLNCKKVKKMHFDCLSCTKEELKKKKIKKV